MTIGDTSTAVSREEAWFVSDQSAATDLWGNSQPLPALTAELGGPFDIVQGYGRKIDPRSRGCYIWRGKIDEKRYGMQMKTLTYEMHVNLVWPLSSTSQNGYEGDQQACDAAIEAVLQRIRGPKGMATHGGAFTAAGEEKDELQRAGIKVEQTNPMLAIERGYMEVAITYYCVDNLQA
jgi:hypothetical protein